jgi:L-idonate 5-dehydrogenase
MKAIVVHAAKDLRIEDRAADQPGDGEVVVQIETGGICGSDLHYYNHGGFGSITLREPMILGHEVAGSISALGKGVTGLSVGQLVGVSPSRPCHACKYRFHTSKVLSARVLWSMPDSVCRPTDCRPVKRPWRNLWR